MVSSDHADVDVDAELEPGPDPGAAACVEIDGGEPKRKHFRVIDKEQQQQKQTRSHHQLVHSKKLRTRRLLRPSKVPKAPQNSTQFIIDDHENSAYFIDFEKGFTSPSTREDVGWSHYFEQDFENVYRTTREAEIIDWTREALVEKISSLEERVKTLEQQLAMCDPNVYMSQSQHRVVCVQGESRQMQEFRIWCPMHGKKVRDSDTLVASRRFTAPIHVAQVRLRSDESSSSSSGEEEESRVGDGESDNGFSEEVNEESTGEEVEHHPASTTRDSDEDTGDRRSSKPDPEGAGRRSCEPVESSRARVNGEDI